jgi:hypothetical protein
MLLDQQGSLILPPTALDCIMDMQATIKTENSYMSYHNLAWYALIIAIAQSCLLVMQELLGTAQLF